MAHRPLILIACVLAACGGGRLPQGMQPDAGTTIGKPVSRAAWRISAGSVTAYRVDAAGQRAATVGSAQTDANGAFELRLTTSMTGPLLVVISSGAFVEPATGTAVRLDGSELVALLPSATRVSGDILNGALVSPVSHLVAQLALLYVSRDHLSIDDALGKATPLIEQHFGSLAWSGLDQPPDLSDASAAALVQVNDATKAALILAGFSMEARNLAVAKGLTPGGPLNSISLLGALAQDLADGFFDGAGPGGARLAVPSSGSSAYSLDGQTVRATLAQGISTFLTSSRNASRIAQADAQSLLAAIAQDSNRQLFREQGGVVDIIPPSIHFLQPIADASVQGQVVVEVTATDETAMQSFAFTAPPSVASTQATSESGGKTMRLKTLLDVSALADGALTISVAATDSSSNTSTQNLSIRVANHGPTIFVSTPNASATVRGVVTISATASGQNGATVTKLNLVNPPRGAGNDVLPAADALQIAWDTTQELEGPLSLHLHAEDDRGAATDSTVQVTVDNVPFGVVTARVGAGGNPIAGADVAVTAIDNSTGLALAAVGNNGVLGHCSATDSAGALPCTLSVENYVGPIQVSASGRGLSYIDPSDGVTVVSIPESFQFTSYVGHYKTGDAITVPLTLWTTLADQAALAYVKGHNRAAPGAHSLTDALGATDPLFASHVATGWDLRSANPVSLTASQQTLRDVVYAALPDVALNQIARDRSIAASLTPGGAITAVTLAQLLAQDLAADGQFDGLGDGGVQLQTSGNPPQKPDTNFLRYGMARALDEWFRTTQNKTGLLATDIENAGVFDRVAGDSSIIFGSSPQPIPYDNEPPTVTFSATFHAADGQDHAPVGPSRIVSGRLDLIVTATDPSGVASLAIAQGANTLTPGNAGSAARWVGSFDTTKVSDGALTFVATASDKLGNTGATSFQVTVDNTPPLITVAQPIAGQFYSASLPADATATDASGVASLIETSFSIVDQDQTITHFLGAWSIPSGRVDGPATVTYKACDVVFNCATMPVAVTVDRTPPVLSFSAELPQYTNSGKGSSSHPIAVSVSADDGTGAGVATVVITNSTNGSSSPATLAGGKWSATVQLQEGPNTIVAYATDNAVPANSGSARSAPYQLAASVLLDTSDPSITVQTAASYYDERQMDFVRTADGTPAMPVSYAFPAGATQVSVDLSNVVPIYKMGTRLSSDGLPLTAAELLNGNARVNAPYLVFSIPAGATEAPITGASFTASVSCPGGGCPAFADAAGSLLAASGQLYLLPLTRDAIPALARVTSQQPAQVTISVSATDAAGNVGTTPPSSYRFKFQLVAPLLAVVEDLGFAAADPRAASNFRLSDSTYATLFDTSSTIFGPEGPRFLRYVIYNPTGSPVAASVALTQDVSSRSYQGLEAWSDYAPSDFSPQVICYDTPGGACGYIGSPCGGASPVYLAKGGTACGKSPSPTPRSEAEVVSSPLLLAAYQPAAGGETGPNLSSNGDFIVPPAQAGVPGRLSIYLARPLSSARHGALSWTASRARYEEFFGSIPSGTAGTGTCKCSPDIGPCDGYYWCDAGTTPWYLYLGSAHSHVSGSLSVKSSGIIPGTATAIGPTRAVVDGLAFSRSIAH